MSGIGITVRDGLHATRDGLWNAVNLDTHRIAVTGLSRAGKTVFLVSLISNLLAMGHGVGGGA